MGDEGRSGFQGRLLDREFVTSAISRSAENRRTGAGSCAAPAWPVSARWAPRPLLGTGAASAATSKKESRADGDAGGISDSAILNFALNLEYLEANFYSFAVHGIAIPGSLMSGTGTQGGISGGTAGAVQVQGHQAAGPGDRR